MCILFVRVVVINVVIADKEIVIFESISVGFIGSRKGSMPSETGTVEDYLPTYIYSLDTEYSTLNSEAKIPGGCG